MWNIQACCESQGGILNARDEFSSCGLQASAGLQDDHRVASLAVPNSSICTKLCTCD